ncbi:MAG: YraN family protein [Candidatus Zixiibacteriota bacterium]
MNPNPSPNGGRRKQNHTASKRLGRDGEQLAARFLEVKGMSIIHRNWRSRYNRHEIDLIALDGPCLVFVEVKSARSASFGDPVSWVTPRKQHSIAQAARDFLAGWPGKDFDVRFDVVVVGPPEKGGRLPVRHIPQAFIP